MSISPQRPLIRNTAGERGRATELLRSLSGCGWMTLLRYIHMAIQIIVAKVLRDELALRGIRSLTTQDSEAIAGRIFERITELELELAARDFNTAGRHKPT